MSLLVPAALVESFKELEADLALFAKMPTVKRVQIDTVDGRFVRPASWPYTDVSSFRAMRERGEMLPLLERFEYEIDLMCLDQERAGDAWLAFGATRLTFHAESVNDLPRLLARMHARYTAGAGFLPGLVAFGVALSAASDIALIEPVLPLVDYVQFMGIRRIGMQGQPFDRRVLERVRAFRSRYPRIPVQVDGGVKLAEAKELALLGVTNVVVGSDILRAKNPLAEAAAYADLENPFGV